MAILSEGKGVMMWLKSRGNNELFSGYLLKIFNEQTKLSFYKISFTDCDIKKFQRFTTWYGLQNLSDMKTNFEEYRNNRQQSKELSLEKYFESESHFFIMENKEIGRNQIYKMLEKKIRWGEFIANYKKSKTKF
jgi:hypothetical protein